MSEAIENGTVTEETVVQQENHNPEDIAAVFFQKEKPRLKNLLSGMSVKQIRRFVMHVASHPMTDAGDMPRTDAEKRAAYLFNEMMQNKLIMQLAYEMQKVEEAQKKEENNATNETNEGVNNGEA